MEKKMKQLEEDVESGYSIVQNRGKELGRLNCDVSNLKKGIKEKEDIIETFEKKKDSSNMVIKNIQREKDKLFQKIKIFEEENWLKQDKEFKTLENYIAKIKCDNNQKEEEIKELSRRNDEIKEKL